MQKRQTEDFLQGKLEFPGGKIEPHETPEKAALRELKEETGVEIAASDLSLFDIITHHYENKSVKLHVFILETKLEGFGSDGWHKLSENWKACLGTQVPPANIDIIDKLQLLDVSC